jgi:F-type H+-transporting ATPase subunit gamma
MSGQKQIIKRRIFSIDKIVKITQAMEVVSLFRLKKIEKEVFKRKEYFEIIKKFIDDISWYINYQPHKFFSLRKEVKPLILCIGSDKGLCGGFNLFVINKVLEFKKEKKEAKLLVFGKRLAPLKRYFFDDILEFKEHQEADFIKIAEFVFGELKKENFDSFFIIFNFFKLNILGKAGILKVFPLEEKKGKDIDFILEADLWEDLFFTYLKEAILFSFLESQASEEFMRIFTMKQAKENAKELKDKVYLQFHKLRQSMITKELTDLTTMLR